MNHEKTLVDELMLEFSDTENLSLEAMLGLEEENRLDRGKAILIDEAENGDMESIWVVGTGYLYGTGDVFEQDTAEGLYWLTKSDRPEAYFHIADFYYKEGNLKEAVFWIEKSDTEQIKALAGKLMEDVKEYSLGQNVNMQKAEESLNVIIELKDSLDDMELVCTTALFAAMGYSNSKNVKMTLKWMDFVIGRTLVPYMEQNLLLTNYNRVLHEPETYPDYVDQALEFMKKCAEDGNGDALRIVGQYYRFHGNDVKTCLYWLNKSAEETGSIVSAFWLAEAYFGRYDSWEMSADLKKCEYYLDLADRSKDERDDVREKISTLREEFEEKWAAANERWFTADEARALIREMENSGSTVFAIPDGCTHIRSDYLYYDMQKLLSKVTEIVLPDTLISIGDRAFDGYTSLTKIILPKRLKQIGESAFASVRSGMFNRMVSGKNIIETLTIPGKTKLVKYSLGDIPGIRMLRFEEGRSELDWEIFHSLWMTSDIEELHIPDSVTRIHNPDAYVNLKIRTLYAPKHLEPQINSIAKGKGFTKIEKVVYR